jgi:hypothetical protein
MEIIRIALKKKPNAKKMQRPTLISFITYAARIVARIFEEGVQRKLRTYLVKISLYF